MQGSAQRSVAYRFARFVEASGFIRRLYGA
jgi:hypothetical protein